ncbi:carboxymuconolactone decarboxylase family protein [Actinomadura atramentaria]|uniref:carboxymuconolactone decarboxylase family protein n=1 Tax=Actinomadura atramentaria TaxID=1990 RepID=UPI00037BBD82|nr:carboxymuconolactone decarboxylase family protein [Actinomadura atramentaria]
MNHYHDPADMDLLPELKKLAPREFNAWMRLDLSVGREDGAIPLKYRELIALAVAHSTQCVYCLEDHAAAAKKAGATREEVAEAVFVAAALRAGAAAAHGALTLKMFDRS